MRGLICIESMRILQTTVEVKTCLCITPSDPFRSVERSISQASAVDASLPALLGNEIESNARPDLQGMCWGSEDRSGRRLLFCVDWIGGMDVELVMVQR